MSVESDTPGSFGSQQTGNTSRSALAKDWCFTWNNPTQQTVDHLDHVFKSYASKWVFQLEQGDGGTFHLQGYVKWRTRVRMETLIRRVGVGAHWERTRSVQASIDYCRKTGEGGRVADERELPEGLPTGRLWLHGIAEPLRVLSFDSLRQWQRRLVSRIVWPTDDREIWWYWDAEGGSGKTQLARYLCASDEHNAIYVSGKAADVKYAISKLDPDRRDRLVVLFNLSRTQEQFVSYSALEQVKDGIFFSTKYESEQIIFNTPIVCVFANFEPDRSKLSADRWDVREIVRDW